MADTQPPPPRVPYAVHPDAPDYPEFHIVCPYCLYEDHEPGAQSALERDGDSTDYECPECDQVSLVTLNVTYEYLTEPIDPEVPRKPFEVEVTIEGEPSSPIIVNPRHTSGVSLLCRTHGSDFQSFVLEDASGNPLRISQLLVPQGVRPGDRLFIKRKALAP